MATTEELLAGILDELKAQGTATGVVMEKMIEIGTRNAEIAAKNEARADESHAAYMAQMTRNRLDWERAEDQRKAWENRSKKD